MPPWRWSAVIVGVCCLIAGWAFATSDASFSKLEWIAAGLFAFSGAALVLGAAFWLRGTLLTGVAGLMLTAAFRAWEIAVIGNGSDLQARLIGCSVYCMVFVLSLGLGLAYVRWEALGANRSH